MVRSISPAESLIDELFRDSEKQIKCQHIRRDETGPYCGKNIHRGKISESRRDVCDCASLQLWCLSNNYQRCVYFDGRESVE
ncbi:hypothetical protein J4233_05600 [Candidatus Pacearchaeota archaeon]|nr:hypothetical protein [Candidatus Pacearchaeota archaeon]